MDILTPKQIEFSKREDSIHLQHNYANLELLGKSVWLETLLV